MSQDQEQSGENRLAEPFLWRFASCEFDERTGELRVSGEVVDLGGAPIRVLQELLRQPGHTIGRDDLLARVWKRSYQLISKNVLTNAIGRLRRALGDDAQRLIVTATGGGYLIQADVERVPLQPLVALDRLLKPGQLAPHRQNWKLREQIDVTGSSQVWLVSHEKTGENRVFKFAGDGFQLASLRREVTISRLLYAALGNRDEFLRIVDWNLEQPPYFIESAYGGYNLAQWIERQGGFAAVDIETRLVLAVRLAEALALAHSVGVLHKDLKPANVLVQDLDKGGTQLRVVDFGSGRLLEPEQLDAFQITQVSLPDADPSGTPFYVAPEVLAGDTASTASDIYSLGVILYQLVAGDFRKPIASGWEADISDELLRADILIATQGDPTKRLSSAAQLALRLSTLDDRRMQIQEAQRLQEQSLAAIERLNRAKARKPLLLAMSATVLAAIVALSVLYIQALHARNHERVQRDIAEAVTRFLNENLVNQANTITGGRPNITLKDAILNSESAITSRFAEQPEVAAELQLAIGRNWLGMTDYEHATNDFLKAEQLFDNMIMHGSMLSRAELYDRYNLVRIRHASASSYLGKADEAQALLTTVAADLSKGSGKDQLVEIEYNSTKAIAASSKFEFSTAAPAMEKAIQLAQAYPAYDQERLLYNKCILAYYLSNLSRVQEAEQICREASDELERRLGAQSYRTLAARTLLVGFLTQEDKFEECIVMMPPIINGLRSFVAMDNVQLQQAQERLSSCYFYLERWNDAVDTERPAYNAAINSSNSSTQNTALMGLNFGTMLTRAGRNVEAVSVLETARSWFLEHMGVAGEPTEHLALLLVDALINDGQNARAREYLSILDIPDLKNPDWSGEIDFQKARLAEADHDRVKARQLYTEALPIVTKANSPNYWMTREIERRLKELH